MPSDSMMVAMESVRAIASSFTEADEDFEPVVMIQKSNDEIVLVPIGEFMENSRTKDLASNVLLPTAIRAWGAKSVVTVISAWIVQASPDYFDNDEPRPSEHPERIEAIYITELTANGVNDVRVGYIGRDPLGINPPTLGEFDNELPTEIEGRFVTPLIEALKEVV